MFYRYLPQRVPIHPNYNLDVSDWREDNGRRLYLMHMCCDVLVPNDDEELIQTAAVFQKCLRAALAVAKTFQVLLCDRQERMRLLETDRWMCLLLLHIRVLTDWQIQKELSTKTWTHSDKEKLVQPCTFPQWPVFALMVCIPSEE